MASLTIRQYGDPVLKERTRDVDDIDGAVANLVDSMIETMYAAPGTGLAANQVGVQRRIFVYDVGEGARTVINPRIVESDGEWSYDEGCLSIPGLSWEIVRPNAVHLVGLDLDGNEISSRRPSSRAACSSTSSTTSTASCWSSAWTRTSARRPSRSCAAAPWTCRRPTPTGWPASSPRRRDAGAAERSPACPTVNGWPAWRTSAPRTWRCRRCVRWSTPAMTSPSA